MAKMGGQVAYDVIYSGKGVGEKKTIPMFTKQKQHKYDLIILTSLTKLFRIEMSLSQHFNQNIIKIDD